jgi:hypothetical protein
MSGSCFGSSNNEVPQGDNTPVGQAVDTSYERNCVIILAGPGRYNPKDKDHDQFWGNYYVAAQHLFNGPEPVPGRKPFKPITSLLAGECVHWLVYEKAYVERWQSDKDSKIEFLLGHVKDYKQGYLTRMEEYITIDLNGRKSKKIRHKYISIDSYKDVWEALHKLPDRSLTRLYYFGHGGPAAFFLRWERDTPRPAEEILAHSLMDRYSDWLARKAKPDDEQISRFYACNSEAWAMKWHEVTGLKSMGSTSTISFKDVRRDDLLDGVEKTARSWINLPPGLRGSE